VTKHPKAVTAGANALGLLIMFNQEIQSAATSIKAGRIEQTPAAILYAATGVDVNGQSFNSQQLGISAVSKIGGYFLAKVIKKATKSMRVM
jgi:hypothetical protein